MIEPRKSRLFNAWFASHARGRIHRTFGKVLVRGLAEAQACAAQAPLLVISNHTSWWDPLVILHASTHLLRTDGYALMDAKNLRRLPFFGLVGAFGVDLDRPADGAAAIRFAAKLLDQPGKLVWIFPQGEERPITEPMRFREGAAQVARVAKRAQLIPAALRYEFAGEEKPHLYLSFGAPIRAEKDTEKGRQLQEAAVADELKAIDAAIGKAPVSGAQFVELYSANQGIVGQWAERLLSVMTRPFAQR